MNDSIHSSKHRSHAEIARAIRSKIISGDWQPGQRLPTRRAWVDEFGTSPKTMQQALDRLASDGFVEARGKLGTFVSTRPPHLTDYALIFTATPQNLPSWGRYWQVLSATAEGVARSSERKVRQFYGIGGHTDGEDYQNLLRSVRSQRLAGLIFTAAPFDLIGDPILEQPGIPRVALASSDPNLTVPAVQGNHVAFCDRAVEYLSDRGRTRIAALFFAGGSDRHDLEDHFVGALHRRGLAEKTYWRQYVNAFHPTAVCRAVELLLHAADPPDALFVTDDTMVEAVVNGLFAAGVQVPRDVDVVAHANFPVTPTALPIQRLGYDSRETLRTCIRLIDQQRRGESVPATTTMPPMFGNEIPASVSDSAG